MFYKQSVNNVEMVIICLDGGLLDLNRLRYNYFNRICKQHNHAISKEEFTAMLGNSKTMYKQSPVQEIMNNSDLNDLIEKDLYEYAKLKQNIKKDGVDELLQFLKQKKIKVAVISTHKTKRAIQYLQLTRIYQYIDFVIGGDSQHLPLPNSSILHTVCTQMDIAKDNAVVIANFPSLVEAASELFMNVVYMKDLVPASTTIRASVYKTVKNNLEMINVFLFSKYDTVEMYASVLGMSKDMDLVTLERNYQRLLLEYQDDLQLIALVKRTYRFFLMEINDTVMQTKKEKSLDSLLTSKMDNDKEEVVTNESINPKIQEEPSQDIASTIVKPVLMEEQNTSIYESVEEIFGPENSNIQKSFEQVAPAINGLMDKINKTPVENLANENPDDSHLVTKQTDENDEPYSVLNGILDFVYVLIMAFVTSIIAMVCYMMSLDFLQNKMIVTDVINMIINFYIMIVRNVYMGVFNGIHAIIDSIPNYQSIVAGNPFVSSLAVEVIMFTIFNIVIYYIVKTTYHFINKGSGNSD